MGGKIAVKDQPCINPECGSSDARQVYEDETSYCFSCKKFFPKQDGDFERATTRNDERDKYKTKMKISGVQNLPFKFIRDRKISKEVCEFFGIRVEIDEDGEIEKHYYPYEGGKAYNVRTVEGKKFHWLGNSDDLCGVEHFNGGGKRVIVTEGEIDMAVVAQASYDKYDGRIYPVVTIGAASRAEKTLLKRREWLRSFDEIIIWFDNDKAGEEATKWALKILGHDKVKLAKNAYKDADETYKAGGHKAVMSAIYDAAPYIPSGMITKEEIWAKIIEAQSVISIPYPPCARGLTMKTKGMRGGEISLFISGTGSGKSTLMRETALHLVGFQEEYEKLVAEKNAQIEAENAELEEHEQQPLIKPYHIKVGIISLEEPPHETGKKLSAMILKRNIANEHIPLRELRVGFDQVFDDKNIQVLDHQGSMKDGSLLDKLEYMILSGCTHLIIDHITILVSEGAEGLTGNEAIDKVMNDLLGLVMRYPHVWIGLVSHLRKTNSGKPFEEGVMPTIDDIKGSGSIKQISFDIIAFCRNMQAEDEDEKNEINMAVLKCRHSGLTGSVPGSKYDHETGRLMYLEDAADGFSVSKTEVVSGDEQKPAAPKPSAPKPPSGQLAPKTVPSAPVKPPGAAGLKVPGF